MIFNSTSGESTIATLIALLVLIIIVLSVSTWIGTIKEDTYSQACKDIGFEHYSRLEGQDYCVSGSDYHTIIIECKHQFFQTGCHAQKINLYNYGEKQ